MHAISFRNISKVNMFRFFGLNRCDTPSRFYCQNNSYHQSISIASQEQPLQQKKLFPSRFHPIYKSQPPFLTNHQQRVASFLPSFRPPLAFASGVRQYNTYKSFNHVPHKRFWRRRRKNKHRKNNFRLFNTNVYGNRFHNFKHYNNQRVFTWHNGVRSPINNAFFHR